MATPPFDDSRRLTGGNLFFDAPGAVLESVAAAAPGVVDIWHKRIAEARGALGWLDDPVAVRHHAQGVSLALVAPLDQLFTATEVNEWAVASALHELGTDAGGWLEAPGDPAAWDSDEALATLAAMSRAESMPGLSALAAAAMDHGINLLVDDEVVTLGSGHGGRSWPLAEMPQPGAVDWDALSDVPTALITGSNGKTTTTRLLSAIGWAHGWCTAHTCTDGVFVGAEAIDRDDYSGPGGARLALRRTDIDAAILETARGGILRRGLAVQRAQVALVTNISDDHFGEYGIDDLDGLADAKLTVARALGEHGTLVINADDTLLLRHATALGRHMALFALDADAPLLADHRARGGATAGVRGGRLVLEHGAESTDLGAIAAMPLTLGGAARYNIANIAAAVLVADVLDIHADTLRGVLASFGANHRDNPGRLEHHTLGDVEVFMDYAHNPDGLRNLLGAATHAVRARFGMVLGQAGDRSDQDIRELGGVAATFQPDRIVLKDLPGYLRGREPGEVATILRKALVTGGLNESSIAVELDEWNAALQLLAWARAGDTLVLPVQGRENRLQLSALLERLVEAGWRVGDALPADALHAGEGGQDTH